MKNRSGISLITLIVIIMVILIIASIAVMSGVGSITQTKQAKLDTEIRHLKDAVMNRMVENTRNPSRYPLVGRLPREGVDISTYLRYVDGLSSAEIQTIASQVTESNIDYFRIVDSTAAGSLGVDAVDEEHYFIVNYSTGDVYGNFNMSLFEAEH